MSSVALVAGADGCRGGWVVVTLEASTSRLVAAERVVRLEAVAERLHRGELAACGVDIPIGLADDGPRRCDVEARRLLGPRRASVFPAPARPSLDAASYADALARSRSASGTGMSRQTFAILPKVREVDALVTPAIQDRLFEVHPELSFATMAGAPMAHRKTTPEGRAERLAALHRTLSCVDEVAARPVCGTRPDDLLDATAVAWSAARHRVGAHRRLGGRRDSRGLAMEIVA